MPDMPRGGLHVYMMLPWPCLLAVPSLPSLDFQPPWLLLITLLPQLIPGVSLPSSLPASSLPPLTPPLQCISACWPRGRLPRYGRVCLDPIMKSMRACTLKQIAMGGGKWWQWCGNGVANDGRNLRVPQQWQMHKDVGETNWAKHEAMGATNMARHMANGEK